MKNISKLILIGAVILIIGTASYISWHGKKTSDTVADFISDKVGQASFGGHVFTAYETRGEHIEGDSKEQYLWALVQEYYVQDAQLKEGTGMSMPIKIVLRKKNNEWIPQSYQVPGDGHRFGEDILRIFPKDMQSKIFLDADEYNRLKEENRRVAAEYFHVI